MTHLEQPTITTHVNVIAEYTRLLDKAPSNDDTLIMAKRAPRLLSDQFRQAIRDADCSCYVIWQATGVDQAVLSKFLKGERGMSLDSLDKLAEFLNLDITVRKSAKRKGNKNG